MSGCIYCAAVEDAPNCILVNFYTVDSTSLKLSISSLSLVLPALSKSSIEQTFSVVADSRTIIVIVSCGQSQQDAIQASPSKKRAQPRQKQKDAKESHTKLAGKSAPASWQVKVLLHFYS